MFILSPIPISSVVMKFASLSTGTDSPVNADSSIFKFTDGEWDGEVGYIYTYDENRNLLSETMIQCYMKEWFNNIKTEYEFDYNYTSEDTYVPDYITSFNMTTGYKDYIFNCNDQWDLSLSIVYHYTQRNVSIEEITNSNNIRVYPNPSTNYIV